MKFTTRSLRLAAIVSTAILASCAANVRTPSSGPIGNAGGERTKKIVLSVKGSEVAVKSPDWELLRTEWKTAMSSATQGAGLAYSYLESEPKSGSEQATAVVVNVKDYRYISPGARYGLGVMTGNAFIDADVRFLDLKTGKSLGTKNYNTSSTAWQGIFSAMTEKQIEAICAEIVKDVSKD